MFAALLVLAASVAWGRAIVLRARAEAGALLDAARADREHAREERARAERLSARVLAVLRELRGR